MCRGESIRLLEEAAKVLSKKGQKVFGYSLELGDDDSISQFADQVIKVHQKIDVLVNNARYVPQVPYYNINRKELSKSFAINSIGLILLTRRVVEEMKKAGG